METLTEIVEIFCMQSTNFNTEPLSPLCTTKSKGILVGSKDILVGSKFAVVVESVA